MLRQQIHDEMIAAMKAQDVKKLETVRYVWSEIKRVEIDAKHELTDEEVIELLRREVKKRQEAVVQMRAGGRLDGVEHEEAQLKIITSYLPQLMSREEIEGVVDEVIKAGQLDFGAVMREVMAKVKGKADGKMVSEIVREKLSLT
ncbi:hypothetical protein A2W24_00155 [Microgenomates group bacterium RBG_16_45_19]|nr:MAG: hypothetical protein A2W24_00155 [Microgenomates group bacterium RBG_16_45_19]